MMALNVLSLFLHVIMNGNRRCLMVLNHMQALDSSYHELSFCVAFSLKTYYHEWTLILSD
jgi:hypothetical protein